MTADDFGLSEAVDRGILEAHRRGIVGATAVMTNFPGLPTSLARLEKAPELELGIHLNLTCGRPLCPADAVPTLVDRTGRFRGLKDLILRLAVGRIDPGDVKREWTAQVHALTLHGRRPRFVCSHRHVHMHPRLFGLATQLCRTFGIGGIRISDFVADRFPRSTWRKALLLSPCVAIARRTDAGSQVSRNDRCIELNVESEAPAIESIAEKLSALPPGFYEIVTHPGYVDAPLTDRDTYVHEREVELRLLTSSSARSFLEEAGVTWRGWQNGTRKSQRTSR